MPLLIIARRAAIASLSTTHPPPPRPAWASARTASRVGHRDCDHAAVNDTVVRRQWISGYSDMIDHDRSHRPMGLSAQRPTVGAILVSSRSIHECHFDKPESNVRPTPSPVHTAIKCREHCAFFSFQQDEARVSSLPTWQRSGGCHEHMITAVANRHHGIIIIAATASYHGAVN